MGAHPARAQQQQPHPRVHGSRPRRAEAASECARRAAGSWVVWSACSLCSYRLLRGAPRQDQRRAIEILNPLVQRTDNIAVLTFNFVSFGGNENELRWNCTEVYRFDSTGWRIIQTHWSFTNPKKG